jgi:hypothetical protein
MEMRRKGEKFVGRGKFGIEEKEKEKWTEEKKEREKEKGKKKC